MPKQFHDSISIHLYAYGLASNLPSREMKACEIVCTICDILCIRCVRAKSVIQIKSYSSCSFSTHKEILNAVLAPKD